MKRVLIYDDEPGPLDPHIMRLRDHGFSVRVITGPPESSFVMDGRTADFDILVLDMLMPVPEGVPAVETEGGNRTGRWFLREYRKHCDIKIPVLMFSRLAHAELVRAAWQSYASWRSWRGMTEHLQHPNDIAKDEKELWDQFRCKVRSKQDVKPSGLPDILDGMK